MADFNINALGAFRNVDTIGKACLFNSVNF